MNPGYPVNLPPGYPAQGNMTSSPGMPGVMSPLAYTHGLYSPVNPTYSVPGSLSANGPMSAAPPGGGLLYESNASPLVRPYGKSNPYGVPATHSSFPTAMSSASSHTQAAYTHSYAQTGAGGTLYSAPSAYHPSLHPAYAPPSSMLQAQPRQLYLSNGSQQAAAQQAAQQAAQLGISPAALAARGSPMHIPVSPSYQYAMMAAAQAPNGAGGAGGAIYPSPTYYPASYAPVYHQSNGSLP